MDEFRAIKRGGGAVVKTVATSFRDGAKRRARNPGRPTEALFWISGSRLRRAPE
jgi:hypothetical protein